MTHALRTKLKGFTLIELIVVIGIIAILAAIVIVAVNPARQFANARNSQRYNDTLAVVDAVYQHAADNNGTVLPVANVAAADYTSNAVTVRNICTAVVATPGNACNSGATQGVGSNVSGSYTYGAGAGNTSTTIVAGESLSFLVSSYLTAIPNDPSTAAGSTDTGYDLAVQKDSTGTITKVWVIAPNAEQSKAVAPYIQASR